VIYGKTNNISMYRTIACMAMTIQSHESSNKEESKSREICS
jgi:hypothetical protein